MMRVLAAVLLVVGCTGCTALMLGGAGNGNPHGIETSSRSAAEIRQDDAITAAVRRRLSADAALRGYTIDVATNRQRVTLRGLVGSDAARAQAERSAYGVREVLAVANELRVKQAQ